MVFFLIMPAFWVGLGWVGVWGCVWLKPRFSSLIHVIALNCLLLIAISVSGKGALLLSNTTFTTSSLVSGGNLMQDVIACELHSPVA